MAAHEMKTKIAGVTFPDPYSGRDRQEIIRRYVRPGQKLELVLEANEHAKNGVAVAVVIAAGCLRKRRFHIGYLNEERKGEIERALERRVKYTATVLAVSGGTKEAPTRGVNIVIRWRD